MTRKDLLFLCRAIPAWPVLGILLGVGSAAGWVHDRCDSAFWRLVRWAEIK